MPKPTTPSLWDAHSADIARFQHAIDAYHAWRGAQPARGQWSGHQKLAGASAHAALTQAAAAAFNALMTPARRALFGPGFAFKVPALSRTSGQVSWYSASYKSDLLLATPQSVAFVWGLVLGLENGLTDPAHQVREDWKAFDNGDAATQFEIFTPTTLRGAHTTRITAKDPVLATAGLRASIDGTVVDTSPEARHAFAEGHSHGWARAMGTFAWTAAPIWWKAAFSSPAGKRLHDSRAYPARGCEAFQAVREVITRINNTPNGLPRRQWGIEERTFWPAEQNMAHLAATLVPINAALCHAARLAKACGELPKGRLAPWIVQDASTAARPVKAWSGTSAVLAHALDVLGRPTQPGVPTSMRLWKAWPAAAEDGAQARDLAP